VVGDDLVTHLELPDEVPTIAVGGSGVKEMSSSPLLDGLEFPAMLLVYHDAAHRISELLHIIPEPPFST
jgi:hypothetical protein